MTPEHAIRRPILARNSRYRWDAVRGQHQLVFPEGLLVLNAAAGAVVRLCDGRPVDELVAALRREFSGGDPAADVPLFLARLADKGLVRDATDS